MIIRKPYAFLIKYFKIIHITLFVLMTYLLFKFRSIHLFFRDYIKTGNYIFTGNLAKDYVGPLIIISTIFLVGILILITFLMREKKKPIVYYISSIIFYITSFISLIIFSNVFVHLEEATYSNQIMVILRDFSMVLYYAGYYFLAVAFVRGFGFNIKKFNFEKDIQELDISEKDREEIELTSSIELDDVSNFLRKRKRNFMYYVKENSFVLTVFFGIIASIITINFILETFVYNPTYQENKTITANNIVYTINKSYSTNVDKLGNIINENKSYFVIDFTVLNKNQKSVKLNIDKTRIKIKDKYYYPKFAFNDRFSDLGEVYKDQSLKSGVNQTYLLVYEVEKELKNKSPLLEIYYGSKQVGGDVTFYYKNVKLNPTNFKVKNLGEYELNKVVDLEKTYLKQGKFNISDYTFQETIDYKYTKCENKEGNCLDFNKTIVPSIGKILLKIDYSSEEIKVDMFSNCSLEYQINEKSYTLKSSNLKDVTPSNYPESSKIFEVNKNIQNATSLKLYFNARGIKFNYFGDKNEQ